MIFRDIKQLTPKILSKNDKNSVLANLDSFKTEDGVIEIEFAFDLDSKSEAKHSELSEKSAQEESKSTKSGPLTDLLKEKAKKNRFQDVKEEKFTPWGGR